MRRPTPIYCNLLEICSFVIYERRLRLQELINRSEDTAQWELDSGGTVYSAILMSWVTLSLGRKWPGGTGVSFILQSFSRRVGHPHNTWPNNNGIIRERENKKLSKTQTLTSTAAVERVTRIQRDSRVDDGPNKGKNVTLTQERTNQLTWLFFSFPLLITNRIYEDVSISTFTRLPHSSNLSILLRGS